MKYKPIVSSKGKWITNITENHGGIHNQRKFKEAVEMLEYASEHYRRPNLCHICFTKANRFTYLAVIKRFCRLLAELGVRYRYKGCIETDLAKGEHFHLMLVVEHRDDGKPLHSLISNSPSSVLGKAVAYFQDSSALQYRVNRSQYAGDYFLHITKTLYEPFNEAVEWLSYIYKVRSKSSEGTTYFSSRNKQSKASQHAGFFSSRASSSASRQTI